MQKPLHERPAVITIQDCIKNADAARKQASELTSETAKEQCEILADTWDMLAAGMRNLGVIQLRNNIRDK